MRPLKPIKIDWGNEAPPPPPQKPEPKSLADRFASFASASYRKVTCDNLRRAFNDLHRNPKIANEQGVPHTVQLLMAFRKVEAQVAKVTSAIEAGGLAGVRAAREAQNMVLEGLENLVLKQSLNPV